MTESLIQVSNCLLLRLRLVCPKKRLGVATSRVERLGLVVARQVLMHSLLLLWQVSRRRVCGMLSRLLKRSSVRDTTSARVTRRELLGVVLRYMGVGGSKVTSLLPARGKRSGELFSSLCWLHTRVGQRLGMMWRRS